MISFTNPDKSYQTTLDFCTCGDFRYRHHDCKHIQALAAEVLRAETFLALMRQFDCRLNGEAVTHRLQFELMMGI